MEDPNLAIGQIINAGVNGFVGFLVWNLIQQNRQLIAEMRERDGTLIELIHRILESNRPH